jgi:hypothetical protein
MFLQNYGVADTATNNPYLKENPRAEIRHTLFMRAITDDCKDTDSSSRKALKNSQR